MMHRAETPFARPAPGLASSADGWRGRIGRDFTLERALDIVTAIADVEEEVRPGPSRILVTHDARSLGAEVARFAAAMLAGRSVAHQITLVPHLPTSTASHLTRRNFDLAVIVTASHNGANWNGIKLKLAPGISAPPERIARIDARIASPQSWQAAALGDFQVDEPAGYLAGHAAAAAAAWPPGTRPPFRVALDGLGGIAEPALLALGAPLGWQTMPSGRPVASDLDGCVPDPSRPDALQALSRRIALTGADFGIALDGDGDRIYLLDEVGRTVTPHDLMALLTLFEYERGRQLARIAITQSTGMSARRAAEAVNAELVETPIGFKHIAGLLATGRVDAGGGAVGDLAFRSRSADRDPLHVAAHVAEVLATRDHPLSVEISHLRRRLGTDRLTWVETHLPSFPAGSPERSSAALRCVAERLGMTRPRLETLTGGGVRLRGRDLQWLMLRPSTTEGGVRFYGETLAEWPAVRTAMLAAADHGQPEHQDSSA